MNTAPEIEPVSLASSTHGFRLRKQNIPIDIEYSDGDEENCEPVNVNIRHIRKRSRKESLSYNEASYEKLYHQKEVHHKENMEMKQQFLTLLEKYLEK